ncbi:MAG TPA: hypothetical protein VGL43_05940, partial [Casimicrobiaceae bacterium]
MKLAIGTDVVREATFTAQQRGILDASNRAAAAEAPDVVSIGAYHHHLRSAMPVARRLCLIALSLAAPTAWCGPPFSTDDPAIVEAGHVELLPFHQTTVTASGRAGVLSGLESHFGIAGNVEVDITASL